MSTESPDSKEALGQLEPETTFDRAKAAKVILRQAHQLNKPKTWQDFQARCVILFQDELNDPHCKEFGRSGQNQHGIDIIGQRENHYVGIQCRLVVEPLSERVIRRDVEAALALEFEFREIIFATTAPDDTGATRAAHKIQKELHGKGRDVRIEVYGWEALQRLIAQHDRAYAFFNPELSGNAGSIAIDSQLDNRLVNIERAIQAVATPITIPTPTENQGAKSEDLFLHSQLDAQRDILLSGAANVAYEQLSKILAETDFGHAPYALFRATTNLGAAAHDLGKIDEAARLWERAYELRPTEPRALANRALAMLLRREFESAYEKAREALTLYPNSPEVWSALLQAAARANVDDDLLGNIPESLRENEEIDAAKLEFKRFRGDVTWWDDARELAKRKIHRHFKLAAALSVLERVTKGNKGYLPSVVTALETGELAAAADALKSEFERIAWIQSEVGEDYIAAANNSALALRLAGRFDEAIYILNTAIMRIGSDVRLVRLLGILVALKGDLPEAISILATLPKNDEGQLARIEMIAATDKSAALNQLRTLDLTNAEQVHRESKAVLEVELAIMLGDREVYEAALTELVTVSNSKAMTELARIEGRVRFDELDPAVATAALSRLVEELGPDEPATTRFLIADKLFTWGDYSATVDALDGHVDLTQPAEATKLYFRALVAARKDETFIRLWKGSPESFRRDVSLLWIAAAQAWNSGDVFKADELVTVLLSLEEDNLRAALLKIDIMLRQDQMLELRHFLERPLEAYKGGRLTDRFRLVQVLNNFGTFERAADLAYRLYLSHRDQSRAWLTIIGTVFGRGDTAEASLLLNRRAAGPNSAIDVKFENAKTQFFVIEPDSALRALDEDALEPEHPLCLAVAGLGAGDLFELADGTIGEIQQIRHKLIARFHYVLANYESRFPSNPGFQSIAVDVAAPGGLDELIEQLKQRRDFVLQLTAEYAGGSRPLALFAHEVGVDVIEAAAGVTETGNKLNVCLGIEPERDLARRAISSCTRRGCILDTFTYWNAFRLGVMDCVERECGPIHLARSAMDTLRDHRTRLLSTPTTGQRFMAYHDGKIAMTEVPRSAVEGQAAEMQRAITWAETNANVMPVHAPDTLPEPMRRILQSGRTEMFDEVVLAFQTDLLLVSDDGPMRTLASEMGQIATVWLQVVLEYSLKHGRLSSARYIRALAALLQMGQRYLGISGADLVAALILDLEAGPRRPDKLFRTISLPLGGRTADVSSHLSVVMDTLTVIWGDRSFVQVREEATGILLRALLRERRDDWRLILQAIKSDLVSGGLLERYFCGWKLGHFLN